MNVHIGGAWMSKLNGRTIALLGARKTEELSKIVDNLGESHSFVQHRGRYSLMIPIWKRMSPV